MTAYKKAIFPNLDRDLNEEALPTAEKVIDIEMDRMKAKVPIPSCSTNPLATQITLGNII